MWCKEHWFLCDPEKDQKTKKESSSASFSSRPSSSASSSPAKSCSSALQSQENPSGETIINQETEDRMVKRLVREEEEGIRRGAVRSGGLDL